MSERIRMKTDAQGFVSPEHLEWFVLEVMARERPVFQDLGEVCRQAQRNDCHHVFATETIAGGVTRCVKCGLVMVTGQPGEPGVISGGYRFAFTADTDTYGDRSGFTCERRIDGPPNFIAAVRELVKEAADHARVAGCHDEPGCRLMKARAKAKSFLDGAGEASGPQHRPELICQKCVLGQHPGSGCHGYGSYGRPCRLFHAGPFKVA